MGPQKFPLRLSTYFFTADTMEEKKGEFMNIRQHPATFSGGSRAGHGISTHFEKRQRLALSLGAPPNTLRTTHLVPETRQGHA
jgi:hypothetical protein